MSSATVSTCPRTSMQFGDVSVISGAWFDSTNNPQVIFIGHEMASNPCAWLDSL
ncbi:hypothetical protein P692DRAFT_20878183 [Suillus brevipes Sb2]|nr:hypothetical protein P692DRAFT_20878183 [Suillus brevipes Sb2]